VRYLSDDHRHLVCLPYSIENLHIMAADLGIKRCWFHYRKQGYGHHYDIPLRRVAEIRAKTEHITGRQFLAIVKGEFDDSVP
jgi:hypothetical protein